MKRSEKKSKELRRKAHNLFVAMKEEMRKKTSERYICQWLKKESKKS